MRREWIEQNQKASHRRQRKRFGVGKCVTKIIICEIAVLNDSDSISQSLS